MQREKQIHLIEVHVAAICFNKKDNNTFLLIGKRADDREIFPGYWECGGGQVHTGETFIEAVQFHMNEEFGLDVRVLFPVCTYNIKLKNKIIPGIRFVCNPTTSDKVKIDIEEIVEYKWIKPENIKNYNTIPGLSNDILVAYDYYLKLL